MDVDSESSSVYSVEYFIGENTQVDVYRDLKSLRPGPEFHSKYSFVAKYDYLCDAEILKDPDTISIFLGSTDNELTKYIVKSEVCRVAKRSAHDTISSIKLSNDRSKLLVSDLSGCIFICQPSNIEVNLFTFSTNSCQWSDWLGNSSQIICGMSDGWIEVYSIETGQYICFGDIRADFDYHTPLVKISNGTTVAYGCINGSVILHDIVNNCRLHKFSYDDPRPVELLLLSHNESLLFVVHEGSKEIVILNLQSKIWSILFDVSHANTSIIFLFDTGLWIVSVGNKSLSDSNARCKIGIWNITTLKILDHFDLDGEVLFAELIDKNRLLVSLKNGLIHIVDITNKTVLGTTNIGDSEQNLVKYFKNEKLFITSSANKIINIFEV